MNMRKQEMIDMIIKLGERVSALEAALATAGGTVPVEDKFKSQDEILRHSSALDFYNVPKSSHTNFKTTFFANARIMGEEGIDYRFVWTGKAKASEFSLDFIENKFMPYMREERSKLTKYRRPEIAHTKEERIEEIGFVLAAEARSIIETKNKLGGHVRNYDVASMLRCNSNESTSAFACFKKGAKGTKFSLPLVEYVRDNFASCRAKYNKMAKYNSDLRGI